VGTRGRGLSLRLFVAEGSPDSAIAIANLEALFPKRDSSHVEIEIVDVQREPARAARDRIMVTPTLLKVFPSPTCRILGNLKNRDALLHLLGIGLPAGNDVALDLAGPDLDWSGHDE
jgi:circadian clock protein KaiB